VVGDRRPPSRGDRQRARIIASVTDLLGDIAVTDLSVMRIAKEAGVTRPVFYFYFESKYAAVAAALELVWQEFDAARNLTNPGDVTSGPRAVTRQLLGNAVAVWRRNSGLLNACVLARTSDPQLDAMWRSFVTAQTRRIIELFTGLREPIRVRPTSDDLPGLVEVLLGMTVWALLEESAETDPAASDLRMDSVTAVWVAAIWEGPK
jgi:TetR/AcrR family transcriptional regulator, ethionamide resistance regulator